MWKFSIYFADATAQSKFIIKEKDFYSFQHISCNQNYLSKSSFPKRMNIYSNLLCSFRKFLPFEIFHFCKEIAKLLSLGYVDVSLFVISLFWTQSNIIHSNEYLSWATYLHIRQTRFINFLLELPLSWRTAQKNKEHFFSSIVLMTYIAFFYFSKFHIRTNNEKKNFVFPSRGWSSNKFKWIVCVIKYDVNTPSHTKNASSARHCRFVGTRHTHINFNACDRIFICTAVFYTIFYLVIVPL